MLDIGKMVDAVLDTIDKPMRAFHERLKALETRTPEKGENGRDGPPGEKGRDGRDANAVIVSPALANQVTSALRLLHESPPIAQRSARPLLVPRVIRIDRDEDGGYVPVYAETQS